jgi:hypothetical protein
VALRTVIDYLSGEAEHGIELARFVLYGRQAYETYRRALQRVLEQGG